MLDQSMLARDRRRETLLVGVVSLLLALEIGISMLKLHQTYPLLGLAILRFNQFLGGVSCTLILIWTVLRLFRLRKKRSVLFLFGLFIWVALFAVAVASQIAVGLGYSWAISLSPLVVFIGLMAVVSLLSKWRWHSTIAEFGWPVFKAVHWFVLTVIFILGSFNVLSVWQLVAFGGLGLYLVSRYSYNRWIYASGVTYPFKKTASKFYVKQMSRAMLSQV